MHALAFLRKSRSKIAPCRVRYGTNHSSAFSTGQRNNMEGAHPPTLVGGATTQHKRREFLPTTRRRNITASGWKKVSCSMPLSAQARRQPPTQIEEQYCPNPAQKAQFQILG